MKCDVCGRVHDTENFPDIFGKRVCQRCLKCIAATEIGSIVYDYYIEILKNTKCAFMN
jgi:hypothetical protein